MPEVVMILLKYHFDLDTMEFTQRLPLFDFTLSLKQLLERLVREQVLGDRTRAVRVPRAGTSDGVRIQHGTEVLELIPGRGVKISGIPPLVSMKMLLDALTNQIGMYYLDDVIVFGSRPPKITRKIVDGTAYLQFSDEGDAKRATECILTIAREPTRADADFVLAALQVEVVQSVMHSLSVYDPRDPKARPLQWVVEEDAKAASQPSTATRDDDEKTDEPTAKTYPKFSDPNGFPGSGGS